VITIPLVRRKAPPIRKEFDPLRADDDAQRKGSNQLEVGGHVVEIVFRCRGRSGRRISTSLHSNDRFIPRPGWTARGFVTTAADRWEECHDADALLAGRRERHDRTRAIDSMAPRILSPPQNSSTAAGRHMDARLQRIRSGRGAYRIRMRKSEGAKRSRHSRAAAVEDLLRRRSEGRPNRPARRRLDRQRTARGGAN